MKHSENDILGINTDRTFGLTRKGRECVLAVEGSFADALDEGVV